MRLLLKAVLGVVILGLVGCGDNPPASDDVKIETNQEKPKREEDDSKEPIDSFGLSSILSLPREQFDTIVPNDREELAGREFRSSPLDVSFEGKWMGSYQGNQTGNRVYFQFNTDSLCSRVGTLPA